MTGFSVRAASFADVEYGRPGGYSLRMDARIPEGRGPFPAAIVVHGGAWVAGDRKKSVLPLTQALRDAGFAWFSISYRLANPVDYKSTPAALLGGSVEDVRQAVAYVKKHAAEYNVDPERIALIGESAGAQLSAMAALKPGPGGEVEAVVGFYCPSDLVSLVQATPFIPESLRQVVKGTSFEDVLFGYLRELSPMNSIHAGAPPFLLIHGTVDNVVPFQQSVDMCNGLRKAGSTCDLYPVEGASHGLTFWEASKRLTGYKAEMIGWLKRQLSPHL
jgi:acetyl esterase